MADTHTFKIKVGRSASSCAIEMDGNTLRGVRRIALEVDGARRDKAVFLRLDIYGEIIVDGEFQETAILNVASARAE